MKTVEIVVPVFNEEEMLPEFYRVVSDLVYKIDEYDFRFLFVDDGSRDCTLDVLKKIAGEDPKVKYISFSRNFGKEPAIFAGLSYSTGDRVILMDGDLEHPPALIPQMLEAIDLEGYDACGAKRKSSSFSRMFTDVNNKMSSVKLKKGATDFMCMRREFVDAVLSTRETQRFTKGLFAWVGFKVKWLDYVQPVRAHGRSKWNFAKLFRYAVDGITSFSLVPLRVVIAMGFIIFLLAFIYIIVTLVQTLIVGITVPGYVTTLCAILFMGGIILLAVGILGEYIGHIYLESKHRPVFIVGESNLKPVVSEKSADVCRKPVQDKEAQ